MSQRHHEDDALLHGWYEEVEGWAQDEKWGVEEEEWLEDVKKEVKKLDLLVWALSLAQSEHSELEMGDPPELEEGAWLEAWVEGLTELLKEANRIVKEEEEKL